MAKMGYKAVRIILDGNSEERFGELGRTLPFVLTSIFRAFDGTDYRNKAKYLIIKKHPGRRFVVNRRLASSLLLATEVIDKLASDMYAPEECHWQKTVLGHTFTMSRGPCAEVCDSGTKTVITAFKSWLQTHEEAQVMLASVLVVVGVWWLAKAVLALLINLLCPILVVLLAVVCVPQLRAPLLGQNYPVVANLMRNILLRIADNIKT